MALKPSNAKINKSQKSKGERLFKIIMISLTAIAFIIYLSSAFGFIDDGFSNEIMIFNFIALGLLVLYSSYLIIIRYNANSEQPEDLRDD